MNKVARLEEAVKNVSESELAQFSEWCLDTDEGCRDSQIQADSEAGRLGDMAAEAKGEMS